MLRLDETFIIKVLMLDFQTLLESEDIFMSQSTKHLSLNDRICILEVINNNQSIE